MQYKCNYFIKITHEFRRNDVLICMYLMGYVFLSLAHSLAQSPFMCVCVSFSSRLVRVSVYVCKIIKSNLHEWQLYHLKQYKDEKTRMSSEKQNAMRVFVWNECREFSTHE